MNTQPGRILIADDDRMQRMLLTRTLSQQGHSVESVESGVEALEKLKSQPFDALLCDITMPEMDGFEVLETVMNDPALRFWRSICQIAALYEKRSALKPWLSEAM